jgi:hypothetical protein
MQRPSVSPGLLRHVIPFIASLPSCTTLGQLGVVKPDPLNVRCGRGHRLLGVELGHTLFCMPLRCPHSTATVRFASP